MKSGCKIFSVAAVGLISYFVWKCGDSLCKIPEIPKLDENEWWGPSGPQHSSHAVTSFEIKIPEPDLQYLKQRLSKFLDLPTTPPLENQGFQYGFNSNFLRQIVNYWKNEYDWKKREKFLNQYQHFKTNVNGLDVHFIRVTPKTTSGNVKVIPMLLLHGWPGSVREFYEVIPLFTTPRNDADFVFEVIVPSLPGYGFSQGASKAGFGPAQIAVIMKNLMTRLKFDKFYVIGGDWGSIIGKIMGQMYPEKVLGLHSTMCVVNTPLSSIKMILGSLYPSLVVEDKFKPKMYPLKNVFLELLNEMGYFVLQATKPDTIGVALSDTPAGLAAYILEKFSTWTNKGWKTLPDGGLTKKYSLDSLLDNVMIYWFTNSIMTSQRLYSESFNSVNEIFHRIPIEIPTACARFQHEPLWQPTSFLQEQYLNLLQVSDIDNGGHFAAFEEPKKFSEDVWSAIKKMEAYHRNLMKASSP